jgi:hypothetical protein
LTENNFQKLRLINVLIYCLYVASIYGAYVRFGSFIYDDWSVAALGLSTDSVITAFFRYFENFTNRPLAPLYYGFISRFGANPSGYILVTCVLWSSAVLIIGLVISAVVEWYVAAVFIYLACIPLISSTLIFSPGMQSLGAFSLFLWALSFAFLYFGAVKRNYTFVNLSLLLVLAMVLSYEVCFPLLSMSLLLPLLVKNFVWSDKFWKKLFLINAFSIVAIVLLAIFYQKILAPYLFGEIGNLSRLRTANFDGLIFILKLTYELIATEIPNLLLKGFLVTYEQTTSKALVVPLLLGCCGIYLSYKYSLTVKSRNSKKYHLLVLASLLGIVGVGLIHWGAAVGPSVYGYANRGLGSLAILLPLLIALLLGYLLNRSRLLNWMLLFVAFGILFLQLSSFMLVQANFIEVARLQKQMIYDLDRRINEVNKRDFPRIVLADIPEYLPNNFNGENLYSDEVHDFAMSLEIFFPGRYSHGATLTKKKVCANPKRVYVDMDKLVLAQPDLSVPINSIWFYSYDIKKNQSFLIMIRNAKEMQDLLERQFHCDLT